MFDKIKQIVKESKTLQLLLSIVVGIVIGATFYPTKHIETKIKQQYEEELSNIKDQHLKEMSDQKIKLENEKEQYRIYRISTEDKISKLTTQIVHLKSRKITNYYKIIHPDGTVEVKASSETDTEETNKIVTKIKEEFKQKIEETEKKWEKVYKERLTIVKKEFDSKEQEYVKKINELSQVKVEDINKKTSSLEVGALLGGSYYGHTTHDIFGPFFIGAQAQLGASNNVGLGIGFRF